MKRTQSCCCFSSRTGCYILGVLGMICWGVILLKVGSFFFDISKFKVMIENVEENQKWEYENGQIDEARYNAVRAVANFFLTAIWAIVGLGESWL